MNNNQFLQEISNFTFTSKYARYREDLKRREIWEESVDRVFKMHLKKYSFLSKEDKEKIKWAFSLVNEKRVVPSMRSLQYGGQPIEVKNPRIFNCAVRHVDSIRSFAEIFYLLLCGCGVGIGLSKYFLSRLPDLVGPEDKTGTVIMYQVMDTIEGWADSIEALLSCYLKNTPLSGRKIVFDYSKIRPKGSPLKIGGGKAPGYKGLKNSHVKIKEILDYIIEIKYQKRLKSIDVYDILMLCSDAVLSGGCRRSATSTVFDIDDEDMINAKTYQEVDKVYTFHKDGEKTVGGKTSCLYEGKVLLGGKKYEIIIEEWELKELDNKKVNWWHLYPHRARSNNSVLLLRNSLDKEEFIKIFNRTKQFGEPGFVFCNDTKTIFNPCFEISFIPVTNDGICGVQFCNLTSINGKFCDTEEKFYECCEASAIIGTLQAGYTDFPYLNKTAEYLTKEEALLGCSITGMMDNPDILLSLNIQKKGSDITKETNKQWAEKIKINPAARITCVKPEGTSSIVLETSSGIHPHHSRKYFRRIQCNKHDNVYKFFKKHNSHMCEPSVWSANHTDDVITFPIEVSEKSIIKSDLSAIQHLEIVKSTQKNWVINGTTQFNKKNISHNTSCTVNVKDNEWEDVCSYLYNNRDFFSAVSLLPESGDKIYPQAPMEKIESDEDKKIWENIVNNLKTVDYTQLKEDDDNTSLFQEIACAGGNCDK